MGQLEQFDQIILADKPAGISSFGVVARVRAKGVGTVKRRLGHPASDSTEAIRSNTASGSKRIAGCIHAIDSIQR
jgi:hypothetical protein